MRIAHVCTFTPHACGMYETARELVAAERRLGVEAYLVDPRPGGTGGPPPWAEDRGVAAAPLGWLDMADVIVSHSGLSGKDDDNTPRIHVAHGRPRSSYMLGKMESNHVYYAYAQYATDERWKAMVTLWPGYGRYWEKVFPRPVHEFQPFVDLGRWRYRQSDYDFGGRRGDLNCVITDVWREDRDPFHVLNSYMEWAGKGTRLHIYGIRDKDEVALRPLFGAAEAKGILGEVCGHVADLGPVYCAADMLLTPHRIATRTIREALACGLQVVAGLGNRYTPYSADEEDLDAYAAAMTVAASDWASDRDGCRLMNRQAAERNFDPAVTAGQFVRLFQEVAA
ncbi:MAG TPA: hypothetical protein VFH53_10160 [Phycisphaerae bacterium]|nr:hypothetical protein [Phycisphaerae bacterium]